jgi:hypothetical protein
MRIYGFLMFLTVNSDYLNVINQLIFVMVKYGVLFEVRTEFLNTKLLQKKYTLLKCTASTLMLL